MLTFKLLGEATIILNNQPITGIGSRTAEALLIYLACERRPFSRQHLAEFFWEERNPDQSAANLRAALSLLRKQVGNYLLATRQTVAFNASLPHSLDVAEFERQLLLDDWQSAIGNYGGPFLDGFYLRESRAFEEWSLLRREQLQQQAVLLLRDLLANPAISQDVSTALECADRLLRLNPFSEYAHQQKMLLLARSGQLQAALRQYQQCQALLWDELGVEPGPETAVLAERIRRASQSPRHNLPPAPTPFVGRAQELADLRAQLIDPEYRLLTIIGPGGAGKTRLALEAARRLIPTGYFLNGLRFVPLASAETPTLIPSLIAAELGLTFQGSNPPSTQLAAALANEEMLLILDNLEHLMEGEHETETAALLAQLLTSAPHLTLLVTSRQRLHLQEEWLFDVDGLALPDQDGGGAVDADAAQLFIQAARRAQRGFQPDAAEQAAIVTICRLLGGLPLAIELAAAWLRQMSCAEIAAHLGQSSEALLTSSLRNIPARHRSITAVFDYSWALLPPAAQRVLARLALFRGGFTAAAAQSVAEARVADLATLVGHSLLRVENGRYTLHEFLSQYAAGRLAQMGGATAVARSHAAYFLAYLADQGDSEGLPQRQAIRAELPNVRAAWEWAVAQRDEMALMGAAATLHNFFSVESRFYEGIDLLHGALAQLALGETAVSPALQADLLGRMARMQIHIGQVKTAEQTLSAAQDALQHVADPARHATLLVYVAITAFYAGDLARAVSLVQESLALAEQIGDQDGIAFALNFLGSCHKSLGDYATAAACFTRSVAIYAQMGDELGQAMTLNNLGNLAQAQGDYATAQAHYLTCSRLFKVLDHQHGASTTLANAGRLAARQGDFEQARTLLAESLALKREMQDERGTAVALVGLSSVSVETKETARAEEELVEGLALAQRCGDVKLVLEALNVAAALATQQENPVLARQLLALILANQATAQEVRDAAENLLAQVRAQLSAEAEEAAAMAGKEMLLETAVTLVLHTAPPNH